MTVLQSVRAAVPFGIAVPLATGALAATLATHAAVLTGRLSHTAVSGGRVTHPAAGRRVAAASICSLVPVAVLVARSARTTWQLSRVERTLLGVMATAALASVPAQALGTPFERRVMVPTAAALALGLGRLAIGRADAPR